MQFATISKSAVFGVALVLAASAFASTKGSLQLTNPVTVHGTTLKPGDYKVEWEGSGPNVEVSILQGKKVITKVPGHLVDLKMPAANSAAITQQEGGTSNSLHAIRFEGKAFELELGDTGGMQDGSSK
jgi:hypothetical protein